MRLNIRWTICNKFFSKCTRKALANVGPKGEPIATPSSCLKSFQLKIKSDSFVARDKSSLNSIFDKPTFSVFSKSALVQMSTVSSSGMFVKRESTSRHQKIQNLVQQFLQQRQMSP